MKNNKITITFSLHIKRDRELIIWLNEQSNRSNAIREALTETMTVQGRQYAKILDILEELQSRQFTVVSNGNTQQVAEEVKETEPQYITDILGSLGA